MSNVDRVALHLTLPSELTSKVEALDGLEIKHVEPTTTTGLKFGVVETTAVLVLVKTGLEAVKLAIEIWKILKGLDRPEAEADLRTADGSRSVRIASTATEESVRVSAEDAFVSTAS